MSALPVSAEPEVYFGEVEIMDDGTKVVPLMVKDVTNLGSGEIYIKLSEGIEVTGVTPGDGSNALNMVIGGDVNTENIIMIMATGTSHSGEVHFCNIVYEGSDSNPFEIDSAELIDYDAYDQIQHTGNNIERSSGTSTTNPTVTNTTDDPATSDETVSGEKADGEDVVAESNEIIDVNETNESSGEDNNGIPGFGLLTGLPVMLIAMRLLRENK